MRGLCGFRRTGWESWASRRTAYGMRLRRALALALLLGLCGCREVRVNQLRSGTTSVAGGPAVVIVRDHAGLRRLGIDQPQVNFRKEFGVVLLMGPHTTTGWTQLVESIRANTNRVRVVAFERAPFDGGEPAREYRTYTLWIVPNGVYRAGSVVDVVTPSGEPVASTVLPR